MSAKRGAFIVFEGCDKTGKSTHTKLLQAALEKNGFPAILMTFPDRTDDFGKILDRYLTGSYEMNDQSAHLLFSTNRWMLVPKIEATIKSGTTIICDRYAYSGVAYSAAKKNPLMTLDWCKNPDRNLPQPDQVFFMNAGKMASSREGYGIERYENENFQDNVKKVFKKLEDASYWETIDTSDTLENVHRQVLNSTLKLLKQSKLGPLRKLWSEIT